MCQSRLRRREQRNEGLLLLLLGGVLLLFASSQWSLGLFPGCEARFLQVELGYGEMREATGAGGYGGARQELAIPRPRKKKEGTPSPAPLSADGSQPSPAPAPGRDFRPHAAHTPTPAPSGADSSVSNNLINSNLSTKSKELSLTWVLVIAGAGIVVVTSVILAIILLLSKRRPKSKPKAGGTWQKGMSNFDHEQLEKTTFAGVPPMSYDELDTACEEFTNVIGATAECMVYKGTRLSDGLQIAVTKLRIPQSSWTPKKEIGFRRKIEELARMNHENMVNLLAYCSSETPFERILVFEYASNGTFYEHLHGKRPAADHLDWATRMRIVIGAAYGLEYLHHELDPPTSHFKFDASHVFLTEDFAAKLADFGISSVSASDKHSLGRRSSFRKIVKSIGYNDWEGYRYAPHFESNIRSFGVFLLEAITGRLPFSETQGPLVEWASEYLSDPERMWYLVDPSLTNYKKKELAKICEVVSLCIKPGPSNVPTMVEVVGMLSGALRITRQGAGGKSSPLLWAEMQLLSSVDNSFDDMPLPNSPGHRRLTSLGSGKGSWSELVCLSPGRMKKHNGQESWENDRAIVVTSPRPKHVITSPRPNLRKVLSGIGASNKNVNGFWSYSASELETLSPQEGRRGEEPEMPLAALIGDSTFIDVRPHPPGSEASNAFVAKTFRSSWAENSAGRPKLDIRATRRQSSDVGR